MTGTAFVERFVGVASERLARARACARELAGATGPALLEELRRELHTLKGEARIVGVQGVAQAVHALEEKLGSPDALASGPEILEQLHLIEDLARAASARPSEAGRGAPEAPLDRLLGTDEAFVRVSLQSLAGLSDMAAELRVGDAALTEVIEELARLTAAPAAAAAGLDAPLRRVLARAKQVAFEQHHRLELLHDRVRLTRMVRLGALFDAIPRATQRLASELGKDVHVQVQGADVEVDRMVLDVLREPLIHLVRNAVDHGIESAALRRASGKDERGRVDLRARAVGANVIIEVQDDGRGIDREALAAALEQRGMPAELPRDDEGLLELLCLFGVSSRQSATEVSGRGIGLDVVKRKTESVGGRLQLVCREGVGSRFILEVPMSTVLSTLMCLELDGAVHGLGAHEIEHIEALRPEVIEQAGTGRAIRLEHEVMPLLDLGTLLDGRPRDVTLRRFFCVLTAANGRLAVAVDRIVGMRPVLEQRLDSFIERTEVVRSVAVLASGEVAVALDVPELLRRSLHTTEMVPGSTPSAAPPARESRTHRGRVLVVDDSQLTREVVVSVLREMGLEVFDAPNGQRALALLATALPDVMITDLDMPVLDGFELLRRTRASEATAHLPIVVLSTRGSPEDIARAASLGADAYLVKTQLELHQIREVVRRHLPDADADGAGVR